MTDARRQRNRSRQNRSRQIGRRVLGDPAKYLAARGVSYPCIAHNFGGGDLDFASLSRSDEQYALRPVRVPQKLTWRVQKFLRGPFSP
jgi:hypothetical protein